VFLWSWGRASTVALAAEFTVDGVGSSLLDRHGFVIQVHHHIIQQIEEFIRDVTMQRGELVESGAVAIGFKHSYLIFTDNSVLDATSILGERVIEKNTVSIFVKGGNDLPWIAVITITFLIVATLTDWCGEGEFGMRESAGSMRSVGRSRNLDGKSRESGCTNAFTWEKIPGKIALRALRRHVWKD
jgi:hypothetical protein